MTNSELDYIDICIIGAGVVGLAIGKTLAEQQYSVVVLEKEKIIGSGLSSRNSEVIHAGIYYAKDSLKAKLCVRGKELLYDFCTRHRVAFNRCGKLVVTKEHSQLEELEGLQRKSIDNGVFDTTIIDAQTLRTMEPQVAGVAALLSPSTGIIDCHGLMIAYSKILEENSGMLCLDSEFISAEQHGDRYKVNIKSVDEAYQFQTGCIINSASLNACDIAKNIEGMSSDKIPPLYYCKGSYFSLSGKAPFKRLIYPMPETNTTGLGIHATIDMAGQVRFGPDTEYLDVINYNIEEGKRTKFCNAIKNYFPNLDPERLAPAYSGIRPKLQAPEAPATDFVIDQVSPKLINLFGIESPGLTASLAIAEHVSELVNNR